MDFLSPYVKTTGGGFEPVAVYGRNLAIHNQEAVLYRRVDFYEAIPAFQIIDLGVIAAGAQSALTNLVNLEMPANELGQFRWYVLDNAQIHLFLPSGIQKGALRWLQSVYDMQTPLRDPNLVSTEIFVWENNRPAIQAVNGMAVALAAVRIIAGGYRFHTTELKGPTEPMTHVWVSGRGQD